MSIVDPSGSVKAALVCASTVMAAFGLTGTASADDQLAQESAGLFRLFKSRNAEINCLALNIYWEARSESRKGQLAVAHVTLNRKRSPEFPNTICAVIRQGGEAQLGGCQFSWWCDGRSDQPKEHGAWQAATKLASAVVAGKHADPTRGALYFHHHSVRPKWAVASRLRARIGAHYYYR